MLFNPGFPSIVMLHYVSDEKVYDELKPWSVSRASYTRLLDYLQANEYSTLVFDDVVRGEGAKNGIIITFDDCPKSLWDFAIPELLKRNMKAVFYMSTACLGKYNYWNADYGKPRIDLMDEEDMRKLAGLGMEIGSHAHDHIMLDECSESEAWEQLTRSKSILEAVTGRPVISIAYPYGSVPRNVAVIAQRAGYQFGVGVYCPLQSKYAIRRWPYFDTDGVAGIKRKLSYGYRLRRSFNDKWSYCSKKVLRRAYLAYSKVKAAFSGGMVAILAEDMQYLNFIQEYSEVGLMV